MARNFQKLAFSLDEEPETDLEKEFNQCKVRITHVADNEIGIIGEAFTPTPPPCCLVKKNKPEQ